MILVIGALANPAVAYLVSLLGGMDAPHVLLDARRYTEEYDFSLDLRNGCAGGSLRSGAAAIPLAEVQSVYLDQIDPPDPFPDEPEDPGPQGAFARYASLMICLNSLSCTVLNRPGASGSNSCKPYQRTILARHGIRVPRTMVTNEPAEAAVFFEECSGALVYKSVSQARSVVSRLQPRDLGRLERIRFCPTQFQEWIPGCDIRVHTVGERVFATEICCDATDYRYWGRDGHEPSMRAIELPFGLAEVCLRVAHDLELQVSGIDLRRTPDGEYFGFEVNPAPAYAYFQFRTGQPIGEAIAQLLCSRHS